MGKGIRRACALIALVAASPLVMGKDGVPEVELNPQQLSMEFDDAMQTWADGPARGVRIESGPALTCRWDSDTRLVCESRTGSIARPAHAYRIQLPAFTAQSGRVVAARGVHVETQRPELSVYGWGMNWTAALPRVVVIASQKASATAVSHVLRLTINGKPQKVALRATKNDHEFELLLPRGDHPDGLLELGVVPGFVSMLGPLPGKQNRTLLLARLQPTPRLLDAQCDGRNPARATSPAEPHSIRCDPGDVVLHFSRPMDEASKTTFARSLPTGVSVQRWRDNSAYGSITQAPGQDVTVRFVRACSTARIEITRALRSADGAPFAPSTFTISTGDQLPAVTAPHASLLLGEGPHPGALATAINTPHGALLTMDGLASAPVSATFAAPTGEPNVALPIADRATDAVLAAGGWARWSDAGNTSSDPSLQFAAPQLDVIAISGVDEVLAWTRRWSGEPASAARAELILHQRGHDEVVATAMASGDGIARLKIPEALRITREESKGREWFVRVQEGARRAVLPVGNVDAYRLNLARPGELRQWGVSDRPLYHAGDTVHFRLWQREFIGNRVLASTKTASRLHLVSFEENKPILSWDVAPGRDGWNGTVEIPRHATDGTYCVTPNPAARDYSGACFFIGTYRAQDLWVQATATDRLLRLGDRLDVGVNAGYYSGGPASGIAVQHVNTLLMGLPLSQAYPQFAGFEFVNVNASPGGVRLDVPEHYLPTDPQGNTVLALPIRFSTAPGKGLPPAFGRLQAVVEIGLQSRERTTSNASVSRFTAFEQFVGLRMEPRWPDSTSKVTAEAVVIDAEGNALAGREVDVSIDYLEGYEKDAPATRVGSCHLRTGAGQQSCDFPRVRSGRYRLTARSGTAAPAEAIRYVWLGGTSAQQPETPDPVLEIITPPSAESRRVTVSLRQALPARAVLLVLSQKGSIVEHQVLTDVAPENRLSFDLPTSAGEFEVRAYVVRPASVSTEPGLRSTASIDVAKVTIKPVESTATPIVVTFDRPSASPGLHATLHLRNDSGKPRDVTVSVMDDAMRALAQDDFDNPTGENWLDADGEYSAALDLASFAGWNSGPGVFALTAAARRGSGKNQNGIGRAIDAVLVSRRRQVYEEASSPVLASLGDAPAAPASAPAPAAAAESSELDMVTVTGSRISAVEGFSAGPGRKDVATTARPRTIGEQLAAPQRAPAFGARIRQNFADTALWIPDLRLAPGESRDIDVPLPDNLTRWRAMVWSTDGEQFDRTDAAISSGLPVEARIQAPVRLYPGDHARLSGNVHQPGGSASSAQVQLTAKGAAVDAVTESTIALPAGGQAAFLLDITAAQIGSIDVVSAARVSDHADAVRAAIEVASPTIEEKRIQAGWIGETGVNLTLPTLPSGASDPHLQVTVLRSGLGLVNDWTRTLRDYPHRCWEQILSRAVGAALVLQRGDASWPDASAVVKEALDNLAVFQDGDGDFHYFVENSESGFVEPRREIALTAYSVRALELLQQLGHPVRADVLEKAREFLTNAAKNPTGETQRTEAALAGSAIALPQATRTLLWSDWSRLPVAAQVALTSALRADSDARQAEAVRRLLDDAPLRGSHRVLHESSDDSRWMASPLREQCALIRMLQNDVSMQTQRRELIAGLSDLYAGGNAGVDTQSSAVCLMALNAAATSFNEPLEVRLRMKPEEATVGIPAGAAEAGWSSSVSTGSRLLELRNSGNADTPVSYVAQLSYLEDARKASASAVGFALDRRYEVLRAGQWKPVSGDVHEGDWVRITLTVSTSARRNFVAVTDAVPGGLQPTDLRLNGVAGLDLNAVSSTGTGLFQTRRLDSRSPRFYAQWLPAGRHEIHYFARVGNPGEFLAAPAVAELMYGTATRARTASATLLIKAGDGRGKQVAEAAGRHARFATKSDKRPRTKATQRAQIH